MRVSVKITVTVPSKLFDLEIFKQEIRRAQKEVTAPKLKHMFEGTVQGWNNKPYFSQRQTENFNMIAIAVYASGRNEEQYRLVNNGAREHPIYPKNRRGFLIFQEGYVSATRPGSLRSRKAVRFGNLVGLRSVQHPGFEARNFDVQIADLYGEEFVHDMEEAIHMGVGRTQSTPGF